MHLASDNSGPVHPDIMAGLQSANAGYALPYGNDALTERAVAKVRDVFEAPDAAVYFVATGTAANALLLSTMMRPWQTIYCAPEAHIAVDECGAPEFYSGGGKLTLVGGRPDRITAEALADAMNVHAGDDVHGVQQGPVSITSVTEWGTLYQLDEIRDIATVTHAHGQKLHLDGARFANAAEVLGCTAAEMSWKAGVDAVSFGGTKNGCMGVEAAVIFDPELAWEFELRRKRGAHLFSKNRYLSAQMDAYLTDDLWRRMAAMANANGQKLAKGMLELPGVEMMYPPEANMIFARFPRAAHRRLKAAGADYKMHGGLEGDPNEMIGSRLVADWSLGADKIETFLDLLRG